MINSIGGRKAAISFATVIICVAVVALKGDVPAGLGDMLKFILGSFILGNVGADVVAVAASKASATPPAVVELPAVLEQRVGQLESTQAEVVRLLGVTQQNLAYVAERIPGGMNSR